MGCALVACPKNHVGAILQALIGCVVWHVLCSLVLLPCLVLLVLTAVYMYLDGANNRKKQRWVCDNDRPQIRHDTERPSPPHHLAMGPDSAETVAIPASASLSGRLSGWRSDVLFFFPLSQGYVCLIYSVPFCWFLHVLCSSSWLGCCCSVDTSQRGLGPGLAADPPLGRVA